MSLPKIEATGNITRPPELRFTSVGKAVLNLTVACSDGTRGSATEKTTFLDCSAWGTLAENIAESNLQPGTRVSLTGRLEQRSYEAKDGSGKRTALSVVVDTLGVDLRWAVATVRKADAPTGSVSGAKTEDPWSDTPPF